MLYSLPISTARLMEIEMKLPVKIGYSDGSGLDELCITDADDNVVVWGRTSLEPGTSGVKDAKTAAEIVAALNAVRA